MAGGAGEGGVTGARGGAGGRVRGGLVLAAEPEAGTVLGSAVTAALGLALGSGGIDSAASDAEGGGAAVTGRAVAVVVAAGAPAAGDVLDWNAIGLCQGSGGKAPRL